MQVFSIVKKPQFEFPMMDGVFLTAWVCQCVASVKAEMFHRTGNEPRGRSSLPQPPLLSSSCPSLLSGMRRKKGEENERQRGAGQDEGERRGRKEWEGLCESLSQNVG